MTGLDDKKREGADANDQKPIHWPVQPAGCTHESDWQLVTIAGGDRAPDIYDALEEE